jgi:hypothetical protein
MNHDLLEDLVRDAPRQVVPEIDLAWRTGTVRRRRRYAGGAAAVAVLGVVIGVGIHGYDSPPRVEPADGGGVGGFPSQLPRPFTLSELPERPGPMAGILILPELDKRAVVDAEGRSWLVPDVSRWEDERPTLSGDGRMLGYLSDVEERVSEFVMVDLVTGRRTAFPEVGNGMETDGQRTTDQPYSSSGQSPGFWSPDNRWLAVNGYEIDDIDPGPLLLGVGGQVRELGVGTWPVGWVGPDRIAVLTTKGQLKTVDIDGTVLDRVDLAVPTDFKVFGQWSGVLSPDGSSIAVGATERVNRDPTFRVYVFDTRTGALIEDLAAGQDQPCLMGWQDERVLAWEYDKGLVEIGSGEIIVEPSNRWGELDCGTFTANALAGEAGGGPGIVEWRYWDVLWVWQKILAGLLVIGFVGGIFHLDRRARRRDGEAT